MVHDNEMQRENKKTSCIKKQKEREENTDHKKDISSQKV